MLFDNVNMISIIKQCLPHRSEYWGNGHVIITTRNENIKNSNEFKRAWIISIGTLTEEEQFALFCKILYGDHKLDELQEQKIKDFLINIPKMPLDVSAAAYYLKNTKITFRDYEKIMKTSYRDLDTIQGKLLEENVIYSRTRYTIVSSVFNNILK